MPVGTSDGEYHEDAFAHSIATWRKQGLEELASRMADEPYNASDLRGAVNISNRVPRRGLQMAPDALKGSAPILPSGSFQNAPLGSVEAPGPIPQKGATFNPGESLVKPVADVTGKGSDMEGPYSPDNMTNKPKGTYERAEHDTEDHPWTPDFEFKEIHDLRHITDKGFEWIEMRRNKEGGFGIKVKGNPSKPPLVSMTDESPDEIKPGQQYADVRSLRERLHSIEPHGAGGAYHGLSPEGREIAKQIDPMIKPGQGGAAPAVKPSTASIPTINLKQYNPGSIDRFSPLASIPGGSFAPYHFKFEDEKGRVHGSIHLEPQESYRKNGKEVEAKGLHVHWIQALDPRKNNESRTAGISDYNFKTDFAPGYMLQVLKQLKQKFPEATYLEGVRISGAKAGTRDVHQRIRLPELD